MKLKSLLYIKVWLLALLLASCDHKELCYHHPHTVKMRVDVDWSQFVKEDPTGMTVMVYPDGGGKPMTFLTHTLDHQYVNLEEGMYHTLVFNQSTTEFGSVQFENMNSYADAEVVSRSQDSRWYEGRAESGRVVVQPEWMAADHEESLVVTADMVENGYVEGKYRNNSKSEYVLSRLTPLNIIYTVHVKVHIKGIYNLRSARAALDGMADGYRFFKEQPTDVPAAYLMEEWEMTRDSSDPTRGYIEGTLYCFGLPSNHTQTADENQFKLSLLLVDNKTKLDFPFLVGDKFVRRGDASDLELYLELDLADPLPDVEPQGGSSSGFDATVEDWGDEIEQDIPL